ncbi:MAG TPA: hypothetical protein VMH31_05205 [Methylomirabilota bacterium]|nr:hypothetical protein [Methylomirabilota bacterium]
MSNTAGIRWLCPSRDCRWSMVSTVAADEGNAPRCVCGQQMEQVETVPVMSYLEFLRGDLELGGSSPEED